MLQGWMEIGPGCGRGLGELDVGVGGTKDTKGRQGRGGG